MISESEGIRGLYIGDFVLVLNLYRSPSVKPMELKLDRNYKRARALEKSHFVTVSSWLKPEYI